MQNWYYVMCVINEQNIYFLTFIANIGIGIYCVYVEMNTETICLYALLLIMSHIRL